MNRPDDGSTTEPPTDAQRAAAKERSITARELLGDERLLRIEHNGEFYTLRLTRNNRLILTK